MASKHAVIPPNGVDSNPIDKEGLCLLSLDGGGVRGLSTLRILKRIMDGLNRSRKERGLPSRLPCEVFDMIGGTSTGGLIAIMLGRLGMTIDECIQAYEELMGSIFGSKAHWSKLSMSANVNAQYDSKKVRTAIEKVLVERNISTDTLLNDGTARRCKIFVCCVAWESKEAVRIRSYHQDLLDNVPATICEAALATSAATTFFEPVTIGNRQYVDGAVRRNNPVEEVEAEAQNVWCATDHVELKSLVKCFLSIGTGQPTKKAMSNNVFKLIDDLKSFATDTEQVNKSFQDRWRRHLSERRLFRFNVEQGLQDVDLADYKKQGAIVGVTDEYMNERHQQVDLQACVENLREKDLRGTPLDFHITVSDFTARRYQGNYDSKEIRDCRAVLRVTNVEKDRDDLMISKGARVAGTFEWITTDKRYLDWLGSGPDSIWVTAGPGRGKTMLSLFVLETLEQHTRDTDQRADIYYFFCSSAEGSRRSAISVFRSLIFQIVNKHADLMKHVLDYLSNNRPIHAKQQSEDEKDKQSRTQDKKDQRSSSVSGQLPAEGKTAKSANLMKNFLRSPVGGKSGPESKTTPLDGGQAEEKLDEKPANDSSFFQSMLGTARREDPLKHGAEKQQETPVENGPSVTTDTMDKDSPKSRQLELLDVSELSFILRKLLRELTSETVYFLLDGVDECIQDDQKELTSTLLKLWDVKPGKFKMIGVSRYIGGINRVPTIDLEDTKQTAGDIEKFVSKSVEQLASVDGFKDIQEQVEQTLIESADGTFLWVSLVMQEIEGSETCTEILAAIEHIPQGLDNKYNHMLQQIEPAHQQKVVQILRWVAAAVRPLTLSELSEVIDAPASDLMSPEQAVRDVVTKAKGLLKIQGTEVTLIHASAREFLLSVDAGQEAGAEKVLIGMEELQYELAQSCYNVIIGSRLSKSEKKISSLSDKDEPKLLKYAIKYWMEHVKASGWAEKNFDPEAEFFQRESKIRKNWWTSYLEDSQNDDPKNFNRASLLHLGAYFGIEVWVKQAFEGKGRMAMKGTILAESDRYSRTPLHIAVEQGHNNVVALLLDLGVNVESKEASLSASALHLAARNGHKDICKILLDHEARINARNRFYSTPLTEAARGGHMEVVKLLVDRNADINGSIDKKRKSFKRQMQEIRGYTKRALEKIDGLAYAERSTPVIEAARHNHAGIIKYLIHNDANIEAKTLAGLSALHVAAYHGQMKAVEVLVGNGANIEKKDESMRTALFMAAWQNHADLVKWLLERDANSEASTNWEETPLYVSSKNGLVEPMKVLLDAGAKIEHRDNDGYTPLAVAAEFGRVEAVKLLLDRNAKLDALDHWGDVPLTQPIHKNLTDALVETVQVLLDRGGDVNHRNNKGHMPLMMAAALPDKDSASIVQTLLKKGANIDAGCNLGRTALMYSFKWGSHETSELLLEQGAAVDAKDTLGDTALIVAAGYCSTKAIELLLNHKADIEARDKFGLNPLIKASKCGWEDVVQLLLDRGAKISTKDNEDKTAIDHAAARERGNIIKLLRARGASGLNLTRVNRAVARVSKLHSRPEEVCRELEEKWENIKLKEIQGVETVEDDGASLKEYDDSEEQAIEADMLKGKAEKEKEDEDERDDSPVVPPSELSSDSD